MSKLDKKLDFTIFKLNHDEDDRIKLTRQRDRLEAALRAAVRVGRRPSRVDYEFQHDYATAYDVWEKVLDVVAELDAEKGEKP